MLRHLLVIIICGFIYNSSFLFCENADAYLINIRKQIQNIPDSAKYILLLDSIKKDKKLEYSFDYARLYLEIATSKADSANIAEGNYQVATYYRLKGDYSYSLEYFAKALNYYISHDNIPQTIRTYINLGMIYVNTSDIDSSYHFYKKALEHSERAKDFNNIGISCHNLANVLCLKKDYSNALYFARKAIESYNKLDDFADPPKNFGYTITYRYIGNIFHELKQYDSAIYYYSKAIEIGKKIGWMVVITEPMCDLGRLYNDQSLYSKALIELKESYRLMNIEPRYRMKAACLKQLSIAYEGLHDYQTSLEYYKLYKSECDTLAKYDIRAIEAKLNLEKVEEASKIKSRNDDREKQYLILISITIFVIFLVILLLLYSKYKLKKKLNESLEDLNLTKTKLFSIISHDLKSPIEALFQVVSINSSDKNIILSVSKIKTLIDNLLNWSRIQLGGMKLFLTEIDLKELINENLEICSSLANNKNITLINNIESNIRINIDRQSIGLALRNILINAIKYSFSGGRIEIFSKFEENGISIFIKDFGIGFSADTKESLFNLGATKIKSGTNSEIGSGLGLIIAKDIIEKHYGELSILDNSEGGAIIKISLLNE